jgi:hypothetical protein
MLDPRTMMEKMKKATQPVKRGDKPPEEDPVVVDC